MREGLGLVGWGWSVVVCAFGFEVGRLWLVGRGLRWRVWGWWVQVGEGEVRVGRSWFLLAGLEVVGWGRSVVVCALRLVGRCWSVVVSTFRFGVGRLGLVGRGLCLQVWNWWVGVGPSWFVL